VFTHRCYSPRERTVSRPKISYMHYTFRCAVLFLSNMSQNFFRGLLGLQSSFGAEIAVQQRQEASVVLSKYMLWLRGTEFQDAEELDATACRLWQVSLTKEAQKRREPAGFDRQRLTGQQSCLLGSAYRRWQTAKCSLRRRKAPFGKSLLRELSSTQSMGLLCVSVLLLIILRNFLAKNNHKRVRS